MKVIGLYINYYQIKNTNSDTYQVQGVRFQIFLNICNCTLSVNTLMCDVRLA